MTAAIRDTQDSESEGKDEDNEELERDPNHVSEKEVKRRHLRWFYKTQLVVAPEPSPYPELRVIAKLADINLTPENPDYPGGSWHTEGQINEHICSTALLYYDNENITDSYINFRTVENAEKLDDGLLSPV